MTRHRTSGDRLKVKASRFENVTGVVSLSRVLRRLLGPASRLGTPMALLSRRARIAGLLYLLMIIVGVVRLLYIPSKLFVKGDATATAANIAAHASLFRLGMASSLVGIVMFLFVSLALYRLLSGVNQSQATVMVIFVIISTTIECVNVLTDAAALELIQGGDFLSVFDKAQRAALARLSLDLHYQCFVVNEIFWGLWLLPLGYLVIRSGFLPRLLGVWLILAGVGWMVVSLTGLLAPESHERVFDFTHPVRLGEIAFL